MSEESKYPKFVTAKWAAGKLALDDKAVVVLAAKMAQEEEGWGEVKDQVTFAEAFLDAHMADPNVGYYCRKAIGAEAPTLFKLPDDSDIKPPKASTPAKKVRGYFAECARSSAERGDEKSAIELAMLEMLEYGEKATSAFQFAQEVQHLDKFAILVETAQEIDMRARALVLVDEGLYPVEAMGEARAGVTRDYTISKLSTLAEEAVHATDKVAALKNVAASLAEAAGNTSAHLQIATAPLATLSAIATLRESVGMLEAQQKNAEDAKLDKGAENAHQAADACKDYLVERKKACDARIKAEDVAALAKKAANQVKKAAALPVKNMADMNKMQDAFVKANEQAFEACKLATDCAEFISKLSEEKPNEKEAEALFKQIEESFRGARESSSKDVRERAKAAAEAQDQAKEISEQVMESVSKGKQAAAKKAKEDPDDDVTAPDKDQSRKDLLAAFTKFAAKRWDTNLASQTLKRLTDRRKEIIGQLWEAVENEDPQTQRLAEKFVEHFNNTMDARRRVDAVVRLMGRGESLDPRTSKWFIDGIMKVTEAVTVYKKAHE